MYEDICCLAHSRPAAAPMATTRVAVIITATNELAVAASGYADGVLETAVTAAGDEASFYNFSPCCKILVRAGGACTAGSEAMLTAGGKFVDCTPGSVAVGVFQTAAATDGEMVRLQPFSRPQRMRNTAQTDVTADGAIALPSVDMTFYIGGAGARALTLADPSTAKDGLTVRFISTTAAAHTLSNAAGSGFNGGGAAKDVATFSGAIGDNVVMTAKSGKWLVLSSIGVVLG